MEIFELALAVRVCDDDDEMLVLPGDQDCGLAAGMHAGDIGRTLRIGYGIEISTLSFKLCDRTSSCVILTD